MIAFLFYALTYAQEPIWTKDTGIFHLISSRALAFHQPTAHLYILDTKEQEILIYDENLELVNRVGGKGQGPGELGYVFSVVVDDDKLFALGHQYLHEFTLEGSFVDRWTKPLEIATYKRVINGWIGYTNSHFMHPELPLKLFHYSENFREAKILKTFKRYPIKASIKNEIEYYNPAPSSLALTTSADRRFAAFLSQIPNDRIYVFDFKQKNSEPIIIKSDWPKIPLDRDWAMAQLKKNAPNAKPDFHDYYPVIDYIMPWLSKNDNIVIARFNPYYGEREEDYAEYKWTGEQVDLSLKSRSTTRIVAKRENWLYVKNIIDEEHVIQKIKDTDFSSFISKNVYFGNFHIVAPPFGQ